MLNVTLNSGKNYQQTKYTCVMPSQNCSKAKAFGMPFIFIMFSGCLSFAQANRSVHGLGKQNSGLVNLARESHLPLVQISSIHKEMASKA